MTVRVGQRWRQDTGGGSLTVVAIDGRMAVVKRSETPKKRLTNAGGGYLVALSEFETWALLEDASAEDDS